MATSVRSTPRAEGAARHEQPSAGPRRTLQDDKEVLRRLLLRDRERYSGEDLLRAAHGVRDVVLELQQVRPGRRVAVHVSRHGSPATGPLRAARRGVLLPEADAGPTL